MRGSVMLSRGAAILGVVALCIMPSTEVLAVVIGVLLGIAAGIPTAILLLVVLTRQERRLEKPQIEIIVLEGESRQVNGALQEGERWTLSDGR